MSKSIAILAGLVCAAAVMPVTAFAATQSVDQITVTASRSPLDIGASGSAVTIITRDDIERRQARYVTDVLRAVPGFAVSHAGVAGSQTQVRVRGAEANHVLVLIDGVRANDPATGDEFRWEFLTTSDIERIEVVRGPQSSIWGSDAVAAVVHVITRSRDADSRLGGYLEAGSADTVNGALRAGFGNADWSLHAGIESLDTGGFNIARSGDEKDGASITTATLGGRLQASDRLNFEFSARLVDATSQFDAVDFFVTGLPEDSDVASDTTQNLWHAGVTFGAPQGKLTQRLQLRYFDADNLNLIDGREDSGTTSERLTLAYQADLKLGKNLLALALEHETIDFTQRGAVLFGDPNQAQDMAATSLIGDYQGRAGERLTWLLSTRYDRNSDFEDALSGRLALAFQASSETRLRASVGTGRKNPTFIERFGYFPGQFVGNPSLKPERSASVDLGIEQSLGESLRLQFTVFHQRLDDEINGFVFDPNTFLSTAENMSGRSKRNGLEAAAHWQLGTQVALDATYTYTDSSADGGNTELRRPRHAGSVHLGYDFAAQRGRLALAADYGGTQLDMFFPPFPALPETVALKSHWVLDLTAQYAATPGVTLFARIGNLLDNDYEQVYGYRTMGRAAYAGVQLEFGD